MPIYYTLYWVKKA